MGSRKAADRSGELFLVIAAAARERVQGFGHTCTRVYGLNGIACYVLLRSFSAGGADAPSGISSPLVGSLPHPQLQEGKNPAATADDS